MKKHLLAFGLMVLGAAAIAQTPRLVLYEEFTGETCPPCAQTNPGLNTKLTTYSTLVVPIKWQVPIPSAPTKVWSLYQTDKTEIDWRWRGTSYPGYGYTPAINSAPSSKIDGQEATVFGASSGHPANLTPAVLQSAQSQTAAFSITMARDWNDNCTAITLTVNITASANFSVSAANKLKFRCVMVEEVINFSVQPGTNGETKFEWAARKSFPTLQNGTALADNWTNGQSMTFTMNCAIPSYIMNKSEIAFVGFIQDDGNQKVAQAVRSLKQPLPPDGLATLAANVGVTCSNAITPKLSINNTGTNAITTINLVPYIDNVAGAPITWTGNIPVSTSSVISLPAITGPSTPGAHTFSYNITNLGTQKFNQTGNSSMVTYMVADQPTGNPVVEGFVLGAFPPAGWVNTNPDQGTAFARTTAAGGYWIAPMQSVKYDFFNNTNIGDKDELYLPAMNLQGTTDPELTFDYAYAQKTANNDQLDFMVSDNCGQTWTTMWTAAGNALATAAPQTGAYTPNSSNFDEWRTAQVTLTGFAKPNVITKFVVTSDNGNNLYIDNVNLKQNNPTGIASNNLISSNVSVFPNPANGQANIRINANNSGNVKITMMNTIGQTVYSRETAVNEGENTVTVNVKDFAAGIYNVVVETENGTVTKKLTVTK